MKDCQQLLKDHQRLAVIPKDPETTMNTKDCQRHSATGNDYMETRLKGGNVAVGGNAVVGVTLGVMLQLGSVWVEVLLSGSVQMLMSLWMILLPWVVMLQLV